VDRVRKPARPDWTAKARRWDSHRRVKTLLTRGNATRGARLSFAAA
jgi:hypothetical protein